MSLCPLRAEFFDQAGHVATRTTPITLSCDASEPLSFTKPASYGCVFGPQCGTAEEGTGCLSNDNDITGTEMCEPFLGLECVACRYRSSATTLSCSATGDIACQCQ